MNEYEICPGVFQVEEDYRVCCALVLGAERAVLWDTGMGKKDLKSWAGQKTNLPLLVLCSHGHYDHVGGLGRFSQARLAREDWPLLEGLTECALLDLPAGSVYDLGGLTAECVSLAGHTPGSRGLLLREKRLLLAGDALNPRLQLLSGDPDSLNRLRKTLQSVLSLPFDEYLTGHAPKPLKKVQIEAHLRHLETLGSVALTPSALAGERVWHSQWKQGALRSEFILGDAARRGLEQAARPGETP